MASSDDQRSAIDDSFEPNFFPPGLAQEDLEPSVYNGPRSGHWSVSSSIGSAIDDSGPTIWGPDSGLQAANEHPGAYVKPIDGNLLRKLARATLEEKRSAEAKVEDGLKDLADMQQRQNSVQHEKKRETERPKQSAPKGFYVPRMNDMPANKIQAKPGKDEVILSLQVKAAIGMKKTKDEHKKKQVPSSLPSNNCSEAQKQSREYTKIDYNAYKRNEEQRAKDAKNEAKAMMSGALPPSAKKASPQQVAVRSASSHMNSTNVSRASLGSLFETAAAASSTHSRRTAPPRSLSEAVQSINRNSDSKTQEHSFAGDWNVDEEAKAPSHRTPSNASQGHPASSAPHDDGPKTTKDRYPTIFAGNRWIEPHPLSIASSRSPAPTASHITLPNDEGESEATMTFAEWKAMKRGKSTTHRNYLVAQSVIPDSMRDLAASILRSGSEGSSVRESGGGTQKYRKATVESDHSTHIIGLPKPRVPVTKPQGAPYGWHNMTSAQRRAWFDSRDNLPQYDGPAGEGRVHRRKASSPPPMAVPVSSRSSSASGGEKSASDDGVDGAYLVPEGYSKATQGWSPMGYGGLNERGYGGV